MGNMTLEQVNDMYLDVLREIGNIGAGNATSAIANMLGMKIDMNVPSIRLMEVSQLGMAVGAEDETIVGIFLEVETDIEGSMMFLLDIPSARYLVNKLMMTNEPDDQPFGEMELSALKEIGNIIAGSYSVRIVLPDQSCHHSVRSIHRGGHGSIDFERAGD